MDDDATVAVVVVDVADDDAGAIVAVAAAWTLFWTAKFCKRRSAAVSGHWWAPDPLRPARPVQA